jgi:hypothetical protein
VNTRIAAALMTAVPNIVLSPVRVDAKHEYRPEIDGLRAFSAIVVIVNHFQQALLPSGYLGVDIFFVISGYVITASLVSRKHENVFEFLRNFYSRRIKRLTPAWWMERCPLRKFPKECYPTPWRPFLDKEPGCSLEREEVISKFARFDELIQQLETSRKNLFYAPLRTGLCVENICGQKMKNGTPIWHDRGHITEIAAAQLADLLREHLKRQEFDKKYPGHEPLK